MIPRLKITNDNRFVLNSFDMIYLILSYVDFFLEYIFFYTSMFSDEDVSREFGNNNTESRGIYGLLNIFPPYFLNLIQDFYHLKE